MDIKITQAAKAEIEKLNDDRLMRIDLVRSGCCSYSFLLYEDVCRPGDSVAVGDGIKFIITDQVRVLLDHNPVTIDYGRRGILKDFKVTMN